MNRFLTLFRCLYCWLWSSKCQLVLWLNLAHSFFCFFLEGGGGIHKKFKYWIAKSRQISLQSFRASSFLQDFNFVVSNPRHSISLFVYLSICKKNALSAENASYLAVFQVTITPSVGIVLVPSLCVGTKWDHLSIGYNFDLGLTSEWWGWLFFHAVNDDHEIRRDLLKKLIKILFLCFIVLLEESVYFQVSFWFW